MEDKEFNREFSFTSKLAAGEGGPEELSDTELWERAGHFFEALTTKYPFLARRIAVIRDYMESSRIVVASHMHAGDGNCHVNIPVNSNDAHMLEEAEETAARVMAECQAMGGEVSGEHGIGITKISFFSKEKMDALRAFKERVDPRDVMNPAKLVYRELPVRPFTFSFNRLIQDISQSGLPDKDKLISLLSTVQICTRCGKCRQVCAMCYPERSMQYHPRNKNMALGMLIEAVYYSQVNKGRIDDVLLRRLRDLVEHCTGCGRCMANCPVKIPSGEVALQLRALLEHEGAGGHPIKERALEWLVRDVERRVPTAAKMASVGQKMQNRFLGFLPGFWKKRLQSPLFTGPGPKTGYTNLYEALKLHRGNVFAPAQPAQGMPCVLYCPGCGGALFFDRIALSSILLMLKAGFAVAVPPRHFCCGYPLLAAGLDTQFEDNMAQNRQYLASMIRALTRQGFDVRHLVSACGSCRDGLSRMKLQEQFPELTQKDVTQLVLPLLSSDEIKAMRAAPLAAGTPVVYHSACHCEWADVHPIKARPQIAAALSEFSGAAVTLSQGCCGESGMGAMTSPSIYNMLRQRKQQNLADMFARLAPEGGAYDGPVLVGCPSCKLGIGRCLLNMNEGKRPVLHVVEWLAGQFDGEDRRQSFRRRANDARGDVRVVEA